MSRISTGTLVPAAIALALTSSLAGIMPPVAAQGEAPVIIAPTTETNRRNSEADIFELADGSLLLGWTEFYGGGEDHAPARLVGRVSTDSGRTWGDKYTLVENDGGCNVMEVNFLRLDSGQLALFYCQKNTQSTDCRVMMRASADEGRTFGEAKQLSPEGMYTGLTNGRSIRLKGGRILLETWEGGDAYCLLSDDDGETWREGQRIRPEGGKCFEPVCIELKDGRVMMLLRTHQGSQYRTLSTDGGETWSKPEPTALKGTPAPASLTRVPATGDILVLWNHDPYKGRRNPLTAAISRDEGETWEHFRDIENQPGNGFAYPSVTWVGDRAFITYFSYRDGIPLHFRILPESWFYETSDD